ncbi:LLM class flavin-dependent oxidoreductase [Brevibacillus humidisoli]|uniref:LLM class flavin-dependent oxidoreductase n=1 Tax=Brevibacillus humidisoli TaxID=2895522 RepID=UPI001E2DD2C2|nr:LLM class flavin-dependent oxidoreductase [Brevibacillus humidisoli]UFJ39432.1 LLM class flavin-dependent oxidoreductase [Brevibacillus humidisoli]
MKFGLFTVFDNYANELPRTPGQFLEQVLEQTVLGEQYGYDAVWYAEHHFHQYGILTSPHMLMTAAAGITKRIRLGVSVVVLPFHDPVRVAEDYALVDYLSGGRLNMGLGSGYLPHEFGGFKIDPAIKPFLFNEKFDILKRLWSGERFTYKGEYHEYGEISLDVLPVQKQVPTWVAALRPQGVEYVAKMGEPIMGVAYVNSNSVAELKSIIDHYDKSSLAAGFDPAMLEKPIALHVHVAETTQEAVQNAYEPLNRYLRTRLYGKGAVYEDLAAREQLIVGSPADCIAEIKKYQDAGVNHLMCLMNFGGMEHEKVKSSIKLFAEEVMPAFRDQ